MLVAIGCGQGQDPAATAPVRLDHPVVLIGIDGLEWKVMLPMLEEGRLPVMESLMRLGTFGLLETQKPTFSPAIWTTVATGKEPTNHGILGFAIGKPDGTTRLFTNRDRKTKALWNIFSDSGAKVHSIGWWTTFPAETVNGTMVAQTNTDSQLSRDDVIQKGTLVEGLDGQVYPPDYQQQVMQIAAKVKNELPALGESTFGRFKHPHSVLSQRLWKHTLWAFRADTIYARVGEEILARDEPFDLMLIYFGGTDVVGHRFWRYMHPEEFRHKPSPEEIEDFGQIIRNYYTYADAAVGRLLAALPKEASIIIVSDHGMHAVNCHQRFNPDLPPKNLISGGHEDAPPGIIIAAGNHLRPCSLASRSFGDIAIEDLPVVGAVADLTPTILALKGLAIGQDMDGVILEDLFEDGLLERVFPIYVDSHDTNQWLADRPRQLLSPDTQQQRLQQLRDLGYLP